MTMTETFTPKNDLERQLLDAQEGRLDGADFMHALLEASVFMPVRDDTGIRNFQRSDKAVPLTLEDEDGTRILVLFTSPERAKHFLQDHPKFEGGMLADFKWIMEKVGAGFGVTLNPGLDVGIDMSPEMLGELLGKSGQGKPN
jgi:hypothetical protein